MEEAPITAFENQVGGHTFELQNQGMLHQGSWILKQLQDQGRGCDEISESNLLERRKWLSMKR